ncbi:MAG: hypothetical protein IT260_15840 [Saprospiraceae bacterium]|nr:hypothetical protein [Saprospiraceae bacterium]
MMTTNTRRWLFLFPIALGLSLSARAQTRFPEHPEAIKRNEGKAILLHLAFGTHLPAADMAQRFGQDGSFGLGLEWLSANNFILGAEGHYFFGGEAKEDPLAILRTPEGNIIGNDQYVATITLKQRGFYVGGTLGKLFLLGKQRSGIRITLGAGMLRHKIRLQDDSQSIGAITGEYAKGYDRLTGGLAFNQFIGWQHLSNNRHANWMIGFEFNQGFTKSLRSWDYSSMRKLEGTRSDLRFGIRATWTLPFYLGNADNLYY